PLDGRDALWLDMSAGPGGKARHLYGLARSAGARLVAADAHPHRAALVAEALARTSHPGILSADPGSTGEEGRFPAAFRRTADGNLPLRPGASVIVPGASAIAADGTHPPWSDRPFTRDHV